LPVITAAVGYHTLHGSGGTIPKICSPAVVTGRGYDSSTIGVKEYGPVRFIIYGAVGIELACAEAMDKGMPVVVGLIPARLEKNDPSRPWIINVVEQKEFHAVTIFGINAEIYPVVAERSPKGKALSLGQIPRILMGICLTVNHWCVPSSV